MFHTNLITPYKETAIHGPNYSRPPPDLVDGEEAFEVEQILNLKQMGRGHKTHYLVKWKGYPTSDNSWELEKNLNADELIAEFKRSYRPKKTKAKKVFIRAGQVTHFDSSPSHLYHNSLLLSKEMSSESAISLHVPSTSPVRASSLPPSSAPSTSPSPELEVPADYKYISADHCGICRRPLQYDHIAWRRGSVDGYTCRCGRTSSSEPSVPDNTPEGTLTPQLGRRMLPMPEDNNMRTLRSITMTQKRQIKKISPWPHHRALLITSPTIPSTTISMSGTLSTLPTSQIGPRKGSLWPPTSSTLPITPM